MGVQNAGTTCLGVGDTDLVCYLMPEAAVVLVHTAQMAVGDIVYILLEADSRIPGLCKDGLIDRFIHSEALECGAQTDKARTCITHSFLYPLIVLLSFWRNV